MLPRGASPGVLGGRRMCVLAWKRCVHECGAHSPFSPFLKLYPTENDANLNKLRLGLRQLDSSPVLSPVSFTIFTSLGTLVFSLQNGNGQTTSVFQYLATPAFLNLPEGVRLVY